MTDKKIVPVAWIEHHKGGDNLNWERIDHPYAKATPLYAAAPDDGRADPFEEITNALADDDLTEPNAAAVAAHSIQPNETDTHLLAAYTPEFYNGDYPPYFNLTMIRLHGDVVLTVRLPTILGGNAGATSSVRFTREMWREFVKNVEAANKIFDAADELDGMM